MNDEKMINDVVKLREWEGQIKGRHRKVTQRSYIDGGWWMVDILSLMVYTKFGCHLPTTHHPPPEV